MSLAAREMISGITHKELERFVPKTTIVTDGIIWRGIEQRARLNSRADWRWKTGVQCRERDREGEKKGRERKDKQNMKQEQTNKQN